MKLPHRHALSVLLCDIGLTLEGKEHLFLRAGFKDNGARWQRGETWSSLQGLCLRVPVCPLQIRMAPAEKPVPPLDQVNCEL